ncbi:MAG: ATP-binding protein [Sphingobacteriaceae bacterium]|nr:ATP-binding protein [Sphingobacteriaceae bacterium]
MRKEAPDSIKKIAIVGPESTGKSTLAKQLATHYNTVWVPEYARQYCEKLTTPCTWQDEINMFKGQLELEKALLPRANKILICDTTFLTVKIWSDYTFGKSPQEVLDELYRHPYELYLLLDIDLPWQDDPLRDFPHLREYFMNVWHKELQELNAKYSTISGKNSQRLKTSIDFINSYLSEAELV